MHTLVCTSHVVYVQVKLTYTYQIEEISTICNSVIIYPATIKGTISLHEFGVRLIRDFALLKHNLGYYHSIRKVSAWLGCCIIMIGNSTS